MAQTGYLSSNGHLAQDGHPVQNVYIVQNGSRDQDIPQPQPQLVVQRMVIRVGKDPYDYKPSPNEDMKKYFQKLRLAIDHYMTNEEHPLCDFTDPARQAHVVISNLPNYEPYGDIRMKYRDVFLNGIPNTRGYQTDGVWVLTMDVLEQIVVGARRRHLRGILRAQDQVLYRVARDIPLACQMVVERAGPSNPPSNGPVNQVQREASDSSEEEELHYVEEEEGHDINPTNNNDNNDEDEEPDEDPEEDPKKDPEEDLDDGDLENPNYVPINDN